MAEKRWQADTSVTSSCGRCGAVVYDRNRLLHEGVCVADQWAGTVVAPIPVPDLLTGDEREALRLSGELANLCHRIIGTGPTAAHDWAEMAGHIHVIQHALMSNAAARAYPTELRLLGGTIDCG